MLQTVVARFDDHGRAMAALQALRALTNDLLLLGQPHTVPTDEAEDPGPGLREGEDAIAVGVTIGATIGGTLGLLAVNTLLPGLAAMAGDGTTTTLAGAGLGSFLGGLIELKAIEPGRRAAMEGREAEVYLVARLEEGQVAEAGALLTQHGAREVAGLLPGEDPRPLVPEPGLQPPGLGLTGGDGAVVRH